MLLHSSCQIQWAYWVGSYIYWAGSCWFCISYPFSSVLKNASCWGCWLASSPSKLFCKLTLLWFYQQAHISDLTSDKSDYRVLILSPIRAFQVCHPSYFRIGNLFFIILLPPFFISFYSRPQCFSETNASAVQLSSMDHLLIKLVSEILTSAEQNGRVFGLLGPRNPSAVSCPTMMMSTECSIDVVQSSSFNNEFEVDYSASSMIQVAARRRVSFYWILWELMLILIAITRCETGTKTSSTSYDCSMVSLFLSFSY